MQKANNSRRVFLQKTALLGTGLAGTGILAASSPPQAISPPESLYIIGPREGYSPVIGTLLSTMTMMRAWVVGEVQRLSRKQLDWQIDESSNSIGAMLMHLAATERYYQLNTFDEISWGDWDDEISEQWDVAMNLGEEAREKIKGNTIGYYLDVLAEVRSVTEREFSLRNDDWLMKTEDFFGNQPTNNHCKWFHVCEHESNHNGQIKFLKSRMP